MKKAINTETIEGRVYQHDLTIKTVQNQQSKNFGKDFIAGTLEVAVDEQGLNVIPVHFTYVTETTASGKNNSTYAVLQKIIDEGKVWITDGKDAATKVRISTALALNDFYVQDDSLVTLKTNEGGFVTIVNELCEEGTDRHKFKVDMLITSVRRVEPQENSQNEDEYVSLKGAVFNFRNEILPVDFVVRNPDGMRYFESLDISPKNPVYVNLWGKINSLTIQTKKEDVSAFGETSISYTEKKVKEWTVTGVSPNAYVYGDENVLTEEEVIKAMQDREVMLAEKKKQKEEYENSRKTANSNAFANGAMNAPTHATAGGFSF